MAKKPPFAKFENSKKDKGEDAKGAAAMKGNPFAGNKAKPFGKGGKK